MVVQRALVMPDHLAPKSAGRQAGEILEQQSLRLVTAKQEGNGGEEDRQSASVI